MLSKISTGLTLGAAIVISHMALAPVASAADLKVKVADIKKGGVVPHKYAFCNPAAQNHVAPGADISPPISWSKGPKGTQSYVVMLTDAELAQREPRQDEQGRHDGAGDDGAANLLPLGHG